MKRLLLLLFSVITVLWMHSCKHDPTGLEPNKLGGDDPGNDPPDTTGISCDPDTVYFQNDILPILQSSCALADCHDAAGAQDEVVLTDYENIMNTGEITAGDPEESELYEVLVETDPEKRMPPPPKEALTADQIDMIRTWIAQGAKNNYCDHDCDTSDVTFSGTVWHTMQNYCFGCHSGSNPQGGIFIENYDDVVALANSGQLMGTINHEAGYSPMPQNGDQLSQCKRREIEIWIENGMPDN